MLAGQQAWSRAPSVIAYATGTLIGLGILGAQALTVVLLLRMYRLLQKKGSTCSEDEK